MGILEEIAMLLQLLNVSSHLLPHSFEFTTGKEIRGALLEARRWHGKRGRCSVLPSGALCVPGGVAQSAAM